jgi:hypothetical protein
MRFFGGFIVLLLIAGGALALAVHMSWVRIPPNWAPWEDLQLEAEPSWFARMQLNSLAADAPACYAALDRSDLNYQRLENRVTGEGCGVVDGVRMVRSQVPYSSSFRTTCAMAAALYWYERDLDTLALEHMGSGLARIEHLGTYACRNIGGENGRRSQHATANAIDIAGLRLKDGTEVSVRRDWGKATPQGRYLAAAHEAACSYFNTVLGPEYNAAHADHFHLDLGRARICR